MENTSALIAFIEKLLFILTALQLHWSNWFPNANLSVAKGAKTIIDHFYLWLWNKPEFVTLMTQAGISNFW